MRHPRAWAAILAAAAIGIAACSGPTATGAPSAGAPSAGSTLDPATDQLGRILARNTLVGYAELDYPPQSIRVEGATRKPDTKCASDQLTEPEVSGYDIETHKLVAHGLGVEACFISIPFAEIVAGNWGNQLDIAYASGSINADRMTRLYMTQPYYATPNLYFVRADSRYVVAPNLSGKTVGSCAGCSHEAYLKRELRIPGVTLEFEVDDPHLVAYETERPGLEDLVAGEIEAFLCAEPVGRAMISEGAPLRALEKPAFVFYPSGFVDRSSGYDPVAFVNRVNEVVRGLHADGTLKALSQDWFEADYAAAAAAFDLAATGQSVP